MSKRRHFQPVAASPLRKSAPSVGLAVYFLPGGASTGTAVLVRQRLWVKVADVPTASSEGDCSRS
jgi:hypothetical protein